MTWYQLIKKSIDQDFEQFGLSEEKINNICLSVINTEKESVSNGTEQQKG